VKIGSAGASACGPDHLLVAGKAAAVPFPLTSGWSWIFQYIDQWSLWLDLRILVRTIPAVLKGEGAA